MSDLFSSFISLFHCRNLNEFRCPVIFFMELVFMILRILVLIGCLIFLIGNAELHCGRLVSNKSLLNLGMTLDWAILTRMANNKSLILSEWWMLLIRSWLDSLLALSNIRILFDRILHRILFWMHINSFQRTNHFLGFWVSFKLNIFLHDRLFWLK